MEGGRNPPREQPDLRVHAQISLRQLGDLGQLIPSPRGCFLICKMGIIIPLSKDGREVKGANISKISFAQSSTQSTNKQ